MLGALRSVSTKRALLLLSVLALAGARARASCNYPPADCAGYAATAEMYFSDGASVTASMTFTLTSYGYGQWTGSMVDRFPGCPEYNSHANVGEWNIITVATNVYNLVLSGGDIHGIRMSFVTQETFTGAGTYHLYTGPYAPSYLQRPCQGPYTPSSGQVVVTKICDFPSIVTPPADTGIAIGETATLTVGATGTSLMYQWYEGSAQDRTKPILGATGASVDVSPSTTTNYWVEVSGACGEAVVSNTVKVYIKHWVALGDSYSSGEGAWSYLAGTDQSDNKCHRSDLAYPRVSLDVEGTADSFLACSGATTVNILPGASGGKGLYAEPDDIPQLDHEELVGADFVTITIGGNDVGFSTVLKLCWKEADCREYKPYKWSSNPTLAGMTLGQELDDLIELQKSQVQLTIAAIRWRAPNADIRILGYPSPFPADASRQSCFDFQLCFKHWSPQEQSFLNQYIPKLNEALKYAAQQQGARFIDVAPYFKEHEICGTKGSWFVPPGYCPAAILGSVVEYFHPTPDGHLEGYRAALEDDLALVPRGRRQERPANKAIVEAGPRPTFAELQVAVIASACGRVATPGQQLAVHATGFQSGTAVTFALDVTAEQVLAVVNAGVTGEIDATLTLPSDVTATPYARLEARGTGGNLQPRLLLAHLPIGESLGGDRDGDHIADPCDNCQDNANATQLDTDGDAIGDVCDLCPSDVSNRCAAARFGPPNAFVATATGLTQAVLTWEAVAGATGYEIQRRDPNGAFATITTTTNTSHTDPALAVGKTYLYRLRTLGASAPSAYSAVDLATTVVFTESQAAGSRVKALHMNESLAAVNAVRNAAGLPQLTLSPLVTAGGVIRAIHISALRTALDEARSVLSAYGLFYKDANVTPQVTTIKAAHWSEIRAGVM